jgi:hypothetical protein
MALIDPAEESLPYLIKQQCKKSTSKADDGRLKWPAAIRGF